MSWVESLEHTLRMAGFYVWLAVCALVCLAALWRVVENLRR